VFYIAIMTNRLGSGYGVVGSWFTDVLLHSSIIDRYEHATELGRLHKNVAAAFGAHISLPRSLQSV